MAYYRTMQDAMGPLRQPGDIINGRYEVISLIGKGASGEVYVVVDRERGDIDMALKYMKLGNEFVTAIEHF